MFDRHTQCKCLALPSYDHGDLARFEDRLYTRRKRHAWHGGDVVAKKARVCEDRIVRKGLDTRTRRKRRPGLVESDVPILAESAEEYLDPANRLDLCLALVALSD